MKITEDGIQQIKISIIIPCYNQESYIRECIDSILSQSYGNFEIVAVDDGSTDNTLAILQEYAKIDPRVRVFGQANRSAGAARNYGLSCARGEFLLFMDSDDFLADGALMLLVAATEKECADMYFYSFSTYDNETRKTEKRPQFSKFSSHLAYEGGEVLYRMTSFEREKHAFMWSSVVPWNKLYKKSFVTENNLKYDELFSTNDRTFYFASLLASEKIMLIDAFPIFYRVNNYHSSTGHYNKKRFNNRCLAYESSLSLFDRTSTQLRDTFFSVAISDFVTFLIKAKEHRFELFKDTVEYFLGIEKRSVKTSWSKWYGFITDSRYLVGLNEADTVPVAMFVNNYSVKHAAVTVESVRANRDAGKLYDIYIFYTDLKERNLKLIDSLGGEGVSVRSVKIDAMFDSGVKGLRRYENKLLYLPAVARVLHHYKRVIYLTYNDIVGKDIGELLTLDAPGAILAVPDKRALLDSATNTQSSEYREIANTDVLVFDTDRLASLPLFTEAKREILDSESAYLNGVLAELISFVPERYNVQSLGDEREAEEYTVLSYNRVKPWSTKEIIYADDYWKYARHSAGYEEVLREYFSYKLAKPIPEPKKPDDEPRGVQTLRVLTWPFRMTVAFFRSMRRYGVSVTLSSVKRKLRFAFGKLFCGGKK